MRDRTFREDQWSRRFAPHVAPINQLVDEMRRERGAGMPYVAPIYGGIAAEVLFMFQDPGRGTDEARAGSGFLCAENDDPSAQLFAECLDAAGLAVSRVVTWNASPWLRPGPRGSPTAQELESGVEPAIRLLSLLPELRVVILMGKIAQDGWRRLCRRHPAMLHRYVVSEGLHTSPLGITNGSQHRKSEGVEVVVSVMRAALDVINISPAHRT